MSLPVPITRFDGLAADSPPRSLAERIPVRFNPFLRLALFGVFVTAAMVLIMIASAVLPRTATVTTVFTALSPIAPLLAYLALVCLVEGRRPPVELRPRRAGGLVVGLIGGALAMVVVFVVIWGLGSFAVAPAGAIDWSAWAWMVYAVGPSAAITEEILFRGVLFRIVEELLGTWGSVLVSGLVFGLVHVTNPDATLWGAVAIALEAGLLFALLYAWTRSLWVLIGFHAAWNVTQGPVLGVIVSGTGDQQGLMRTIPQGSELISGGRFGAEASLVAVVLLAGFSVLVAIRLRRGNAVVAPMWTRRHRQRAVLADQSRSWGNALVSRMPPSTGSVTPVVQEDSSEARNSSASATSPGWPTRPNG